MQRHGGHQCHRAWQAVPNAPSGWRQRGHRDRAEQFRTRRGCRRRIDGTRRQPARCIERELVRSSRIMQPIFRPASLAIGSTYELFTSEKSAELIDPGSCGGGNRQFDKPGACRHSRARASASSTATRRPREWQAAQQPPRSVEIAPRAPHRHLACAPLNERRCTIAWAFVRPWFVVKMPTGVPMPRLHISRQRQTRP
jgi:hypothetical protein